ncbi:MAG: hypothetical protein V1819_03110 [bacterium]
MNAILTLKKDKGDERETFLQEVSLNTETKESEKAVKLLSAEGNTVEVFVSFRRDSNQITIKKAEEKGVFQLELEEKSLKVVEDLAGWVVGVFLLT